MQTTTRIPDSELSAIERLARRIRHGGPIDAIRLSSARARGKARNYSYSGAARYQITTRHDGLPTLSAVAAANSDRRSPRLAELDCEKLADEIGALYVGTWQPGLLTETQAARVLERVS